MGWGRAVALVVGLCAFGAQADDGRAVLEQRSEVGSQAPLVFGFQIELRQDLFAAPLRQEVHAAPGSRGLTLGYGLGAANTRVQLRAGFRYGLPLDEAPAPEDAALVLTSGGSIAVSAGTVAWLQLDLDGFREIAGRRFMRLDAVPGLRFRLSEASPVEVGIGALASLRASSSDRFGVERFAGIVQVSGRF